MIKIRIIPCLDVLNGKVVKGVQFKSHKVVGDILKLAERYCLEGADELVFYDITASSDQRIVDRSWVKNIAKYINIPFCVAGGIKSIEDASSILEAGADKISTNSPALADPSLINKLVDRFGRQCVVIGIDSFESNGQYFVYQYTGDENKVRNTQRKTIDWAKEVVARGAGEIVLNCMNQDGVCNGYDIKQLAIISNNVDIPIVASGGAGTMEHFVTLFKQTSVTGALAASVFHKQLLNIQELKNYLKDNNIMVRLC
jgi:imidazole glycerol-phosphate synthase subunit HisF